MMRLIKIWIILCIFWYILVETAYDIIDMALSYQAILHIRLDRLMIGHVQATKVLGRIVYYMYICLVHEIHKHTRYYLKRVHELGNH